MADKPLIQVVRDGNGVRAIRNGPAPAYDPMGAAIRLIGDPTTVAAAFERWRATGEAPGFVDGSDAASIHLRPDGVVAEISLSTDDLEERLDFDAFEPVLRSWRTAWAADA